MFLGYARGKVGSVVFSRLEGQQITRAYNAKPANPKTEAQATQRMFFASISQYYKAFRYLIEQGQQGVAVGTASIRSWQSKSLKRLNELLGSTPMMTNVKGVQAPQLLPISLTDGNLPAIDYEIQGKTNSAGDTHYYMVLPFKRQYASIADLEAITLGDFYNLYPGIQAGAQLTFVALAWSVDYDMYTLGNYAFQPIWTQIVFDPNADLALPLFEEDEEITGQYHFNPDILSTSWGERFDPEIVIDTVDNKAVAMIQEKDFVVDGSGGLIAGAVITSYYDGSQWARSNSPFAIADDYTRIDLYDIIATYQMAAKSAGSDLYLNQAKVASEEATTRSQPRSVIAYIDDPIRGLLELDITTRLGTTVTVNSGATLRIEAIYPTRIDGYDMDRVLGISITGNYTTFGQQWTKAGNTVSDTLTPATTTYDGQVSRIAIRTLDGMQREIQLNWQE